MQSSNIRATINVDLNLGDTLPEINKIKNGLRQLKIPKDATSGFETALDDLASEVKKFDNLNKNLQPGDNAGMKKLETSLQRILNLSRKVDQEMGKMGGKTGEGILPAAEMEKFKKFQDTAKKINDDKKKNAKEIRRIENQIAKKQKERDGGKDSLKDQIKAQEDALRKAEKERKDFLDKTNNERLRKYADANSAERTRITNEAKKAGDNDFLQKLPELKIKNQDIQKAGAALDQLKSKFNNFSTDNIDNEISELKSKLASLQSGAGLESLIADFKQLTGISIDPLADDIDEVKSSINGLKSNKIEELVNDVERLGKSHGLKDFNQGLRESQQELNKYRGDFDRATMQMRDAEDMKYRLTNFFSWSEGLNLLKRGIREAFEEVKKLDAAMTGTAVVTNFKVPDLWRMMPEYTEVANNLGATLQGAYETMTLYYQQGLDKRATFGMGEETMKMSRIAGMDYTEGTDLMTAAIRGFHMDLNKESAQWVNDVYSELAAVSASDTHEIATAMTKTASIADSAGAEFDTTAAFLTQMIETTREAPETAGTALKTIIARFQELKKAPDEISDVDGEAVDANKIEAALRTINVDLRDTTGEFRDYDDVILEISDKWDSLDTNTQRYIATVAAGARQQSRFIALVADNERLRELVGSAKDSEGASNKQFDKTLDSLEAKMNKLKTAYHEFILGVLNSDIIKFGVAALTKLFEVLNNIADLAGPFSGFVKTLMTLGAFLGGKALVQGAVSLISGGLSTTLTGLIGSNLGQSAFVQGFLGKTGGQTGNASTIVVGGGTSGKDEGKEKPKPKRGTGTQKVAQGSSIKNTVATGAGSVLGAVGGMMGAVGGALSAVMLITSLIFGIKSWFDQKKQEKVDEMQKRIDTFNATKETTESNIETYRSIEAEYETLRKGVDENGKNIGLSAEQYEKFKEMNNQIAEMNPEFVTGYDEAGNVILDDHVIELGIELNQEDLARARETLTTTFSLESIQEGVEVNVDEIDKKYKDLDNQIATVVPEGFMGGEVVDVTTKADQENGYGASSQRFIKTTSNQQREAIDTASAEVNYVQFQQYGSELIAELNQAVRDAEAEANAQGIDVMEYEPYTTAVENLDSAVEALDLTDSYLLELEEANQPLIDAMQQYLLRDNAKLGDRNLLENLSSEGQVFMNELARDMVLQGYDIPTMKAYLEEASQMMSYGGETGQKYVEAMRNIGNAQEDFLDSDRGIEAIEEYNEAVTEQYDILEDLAEEYEASGDPVKELIAAFIREQLSNIKNFADETKRTLDGIFDPYASQIKSINQMASTFEEAISGGDYYTGNEQYTEIIDKMMEPINTGGRGSKTFWEGARFLLDDDYLMEYGYNNMQEVYDKIMDFKPSLKAGLEGAEAFDNYLINKIQNADDATEQAFRDLGITFENGVLSFSNASDDAIRDLAKILDLDEDALLSAFNNYRQWFELDFTSAEALAAGLSNTEEAYKSTSKVDEDGDGKTEDKEVYLMDEQKFLEMAETNPETIAQNSHIIDEAGLTLFDISDTSSEGLQKTMSAFVAANSKFATTDTETGMTTVDFNQAYAMLKQMGYNGFEITDTLNAWAEDPNIQIPREGKTIEEMVSDMESTWADLETSPGLDSIETTNGELIALNSTATAILALMAAENGKGIIPEADDRANKIAEYAEDAAAFDLDTVTKAYEEGLATIEWLEGLEELTGNQGIYKDLIDAVTNNTKEIEKQKEIKEKEQEAKEQEAKETDTSTTKQTDTTTTEQPDTSTTGETDTTTTEQTDTSTTGETDTTTTPDVPKHISDPQGVRNAYGDRPFDGLGPNHMTTTDPDALRRGQGDYSKEKLRYGQGQYGDYFKNQRKYGKGDYGDYFKQKPLDNFDIKIEEGEIDTLSDKIVELTGKDHDVVVEAVTEAANGDLTKLNELLADLPVETRAEIIAELTGKKPDEVKAELEEIDGTTSTTEVDIVEDTYDDPVPEHTTEVVDIEASTTEAAEETEEALNVNGVATVRIGNLGAIRGQLARTIRGPFTASVNVNTNFPPRAEGQNIPNINYGSMAKGTKSFPSMAKGGTLGPEGKGGMTLTGELGPEMVWIPSESRSFLAGVGGPQLLPLPAEAVVYPADMTRKIVDQNRPTPQFGSHALEGTNTRIRGINTGGSGSSHGSGNRGKAGSEEEKWKNEIDWLYNLLEDINELIREREKLEHRYDMMLEKRNASLSDLIELQKEQLDNLRTQQAYEEERLTKREQEMREYLADNSDLTSKYGIKYNWNDRTIEINWDEIDKIKDEKEGEKVNDMISRLEEIQDEMDEAEDSLMEIEELVAEIEARGKEEFLDLEGRIIDALEQIAQNEIDRLEEVNDSINDANSRLMDSIRDAVDKSRQERENQKTEEEIGKTQRRLAYLKQDTSGMNDLEIKQLEEQLKEQQEQYGDSLVDQKLQEMQDQNDKAAEQRERQIAILEEQLEYNKESGAFAQQAREILVAARDGIHNLVDLLESDLYEIISKGENWQSKSEEDMIDSIGELDQQLKDASVYLDNRNDENYMADMQKYMQTILDPNATNEDKNNAVVQIAQLEMMRNLKLNEEEKAKIYGTSTDTAYTDLARDLAEGTSVDYMANMQDALASDDLETLRINEDLRNKKLQLIGKSNEQTDFYNKALAAENDEVSLAASGEGYVDYMQNLQDALKIGDFDEAYYWELMRDRKLKALYGEDTTKVTNGSITAEAMKNWTPPQQQTTQQESAQTYKKVSELWSETFQITRQTTGDFVESIVYALKQMGLYNGQVSKSFTDESYKALRKLAGISQNLDPFWFGPNTMGKFKEAGYLHGGLADYTGPAWLDGTPSKPELVLNARDTENFIQLKDILADLRGFKGKASQADRVGDTYYDVQINVDKIANDYDVEKMAEKIKKIIHKDSRYRNVNAINFLR